MLFWTMKAHQPARLGISCHQLCSQKHLHDIVMMNRELKVMLTQNNNEILLPMYSSRTECNQLLHPQPKKLKAMLHSLDGLSTRTKNPNL